VSGPPGAGHPGVAATTHIGRYWDPPPYAWPGAGGAPATWCSPALAHHLQRGLGEPEQPDVQPMPVGQIVGRVNEVRPLAELIRALLQEVDDDALSRMDRLR
jgi:hypothetical protein